MVVLLNLKPAKMRDVMSYGMVSGRQERDVVGGVGWGGGRAGREASQYI